MPDWLIALLCGSAGLLSGVGATVLVYAARGHRPAAAPPAPPPPPNEAALKAVREAVRETHDVAAAEIRAAHEAPDPEGDLADLLNRELP